MDSNSNTSAAGPKARSAAGGNAAPAAADAALQEKTSNEARRDGETTAGASPRTPRSRTVDERDTSPIDFAILTAIDVERKAVCEAFGLTDDHRVQRGARTYWRGRLPLEKGEFYEIVVGQPSDMGQVEAALLTADVIRHWSPGVALLVGIAATADKNVRLGDIVVGRSVYYYEHGKMTPNGTLPQPEMIPADGTLLNRITAVRGWGGSFHVARPDGTNALPRVHRGVIASGEKVIADAAVRDEIAAGHRKIMAIAMEDYGFSKAVWQSFERGRHLVIRAICDDASPAKADGWHDYAAAAAAAFTRHFLLDRPVEPRRPGPRSRSLAVFLSSLIAVLIVAGGTIGVIAAVSRKEAPVASHLASSAPRVDASAQCPPPFSDLRIGMTEVNIAGQFRPIEDIASCSPSLLGGDPQLPPQVQGADGKLHSRCVRAVDIAGLTAGEQVNVERLAQADKIGDARDIAAGELYAYAQVRGALRAGALPEASLLDATSGRSPTATGAVALVVEDLSKGGLAFARAHTSRREICAVIADGCDDLDPERVRKYVQGGYSLGQIDADAHSRVVYGKCRVAFLQSEKRLATRFMRRTGALGGVGLARATRTDHQIKANDPSTFVVYSTRSLLDPTTAKFGVIVANALTETEAYWQGAVALVPAPDASPDWQSAVVWLRDKRVVRILLNIKNDANLEHLSTVLQNAYGSPGTTHGSATSWSRPGGVTARLDLGAAISLLVEEQSTQDGGVAVPGPERVRSPAGDGATLAP